MYVFFLLFPAYYNIHAMYGVTKLNRKDWPISSISLGENLSRDYNIFLEAILVPPSNPLYSIENIESVCVYFAKPAPSAINLSSRRVSLYPWEKKSV